MSAFAGILESTATGLTLVSAGALAYAVRVPSCSWLDSSVCRGANTRPAIALTFDDGPSESTAQLLEILARYRAPASFFQCGTNVRRLPGVAREVALTAVFLASDEANLLTGVVLEVDGGRCI